MTICYGPRSRNCYSACCYISRKPVLSAEVDQVGLENVIEKNGKYFLKNKDDFGACVFLDEDALICEIPYQMPFACQQYTCADVSRFDLFWQEVRHHRKKRGIRPP
jgi:Fe-S-cluster containining protein